MDIDPWRALSETAHSLGSVVDAAREHVAAVAGALERRDESSAPAAARVDAARDLAVTAARLRHAADAAAVIAASLVESEEVHRDDAERSAKSWLARHLGQSGAAANVDRRRALAVERFPEVGAAFAAGAITVGHLDAVASVVPTRLRGARLERSIEMVREVQSLLVESAIASTVDQFIRLCRQVRDRLDTDGAEPDDESEPKEPEGSWLSFTPLPNGRYRIDGEATADDHAVWATTVEEQIVRERNRCHDAGEPTDDRPYGERFASASLALLLAGNASGRPGRIGLFLHVDLDDYVAGDAADITPIFERGGTPLSYGRSRRIAPAELRRAIAHRDRTCAFPNCDSPFCRNHAHHFEWWDDGGTTDPHNVAGVCPTNHLDDLHARGWDVRRVGPDIDVRRPDGSLFDPTPRWQQRN